ncbi:MAG: hypothetical protein MJE77_35020 [Proteobacteria bacterium]|nr:hypothetical protein [Pseudomonadota bacterium]
MKPNKRLYLKRAFLKDLDETDLNDARGGFLAVFGPLGFNLTLGVRVDVPEPYRPIPKPPRQGFTIKFSFAL